MFDRIDERPFFVIDKYLTVRLLLPSIEPLNPNDQDKKPLAMTRPFNPRWLMLLVGLALFAATLGLANNQAHA